MQEANERYYRDPELRRQCRKSKYQENLEQEKDYKKENITKILTQKNNMKNEVPVQS